MADQETKPAEKPARTVQDVQREYNQGALRAGHIQYQIDALQRDLKVLNDTLRDLNFEAASIQAKANEEAAKKAQEAAAQQQSSDGSVTPELPKLEGLNNG